MFDILVAGPGAVKRMLGGIGMVLAYFLASIVISIPLLFIMDDAVLITSIADVLIAILACVFIWHNNDKLDFEPVGNILPIVILLFFVWFSGILCATTITLNITDTAWGAYSDSILEGNMLTTALLALVCAPVAEELIMRKMLYSYLRKSGIVFAMFLSSLLFAATHMTIVHIPFTFLLGAFLCFVYEKYNNIGLCMACHAFANCLSLFFAPLLNVPMFMVDGSFSFVCWSALCVWVFIIACLCVSDRLKKQQEQVLLDESLPHDESDYIESERPAI